MTVPRDYDYTPLSRTTTLRDRVRAVGGDNRLVIGGTVGLLLVVVPAIVLVALLATGNATDGGGIAVIVMLLVAGVYTVVDALGQAGGGSALAAFARANELVPVGASMATHYAARPFATGSYAVQQGVRTRDRLFVEVGDRGAVTARRAARGEVRPEVYLRVRLPGPLERGTDLVTPELDEALVAFAGAYAIEVTGDELTVLGSEPLDPRRPGRLAEAFALADALAGLAGVRAGVSVLATAAAEPEPSRRRSPLVVVGGTIAVLVVVPLVIAVVMSTLDDGLRGDVPAARLVVGVVVVLVLALVGRLVRLALSPRQSRSRARSRRM